MYGDFYLDTPTYQTREKVLVELNSRTVATKFGTRYLPPPLPALR